MSIEDLHDIAAQLHKFAEDGGMHRAPTLQETHLLFKTALRAIDELASLERRVAALEGKRADEGLTRQRSSLAAICTVWAKEI